MGARETPFIDWRCERQRLQPFLDGQGGVVHVQTLPGAPAEAFVDAVAWQLQGARTLVLRLNGDESTRYFVDILALLESRLGVTQPGVATTIQVASNLSAGGDVSISHVDIHYSGDGEAERYRHASERHARCARLIEHVRTTINVRRLCLVFFGSDTHTRDALNGFRDNLWDRGLCDVIDDGLLVLDFHTNSRAADGVRWPLPPDAQFTLDVRYGEEARRHAEEDLAHLLQAWGINHEARVRAETILDVVDSPKELYAKLAQIRFRHQARR